MKNILYILMIMAFTSCFEDVGNYDYTEIEEIVIDNVPGNLGDLILFEDTIRLNPVVGPKIDFDAGNFNYYWSKKVGFGSSAKMVRFSEEKDLVLPVTDPGDISLMFEAEHKSTGITKYVTVSARGTSIMSNGFYLLKETEDGKTEIDMIGFDSQTGEATVYSNLLSSQLGQGLEGKPVDIDFWGYRVEDFENAKLVAVPALRIASKEDIVVINTDKFEVLGRFDDLFMGEIPVERDIQALKSINKITMLINDGKAYTHTNYHIEKYGDEIKEYGGNRFQSVLDGDYSLSSEITWPARDDGRAFLTFDNNSGLFKYVVTTAIEPLDVREFSGESAFKDDLKSELLFMETTDAGTFSFNSYALLKKKEQPDSLILIDMNVSNLSLGYLRQNKRDTLMAADYQIGDASIWCVHQHLRVIYFSIGDKLYKYDTGSKTEELILSFNGEEISHIDVVNEFYTVDGALPHEMEHTKLVVATSSSNGYSFYKYNMNGAVLEATPYFTAKGEGKVKDYVFVKPSVTPMWMRMYN